LVWLGTASGQFRLRRPFYAFLTHGAEHADEFYELHVPAHSEVMIQVHVRPRTAFKQFESVFGCYGDRSTRPEALKHDYLTRLDRDRAAGVNHLGSRHRCRDRIPALRMAYLQSITMLSCPPAASVRTWVVCTENLDPDVMVMKSTQNRV
jgi:hypothetical protein